MNQTTTSHPWHHLDHDEIVRLTRTSLDKGLDTAEARRRLDELGANAIARQQGPGPLRLFFQQFNQPLVFLLLVATAVTLALAEWVDAGVIFGVVLVNAVIGFIQESKAVKAIDALSRSMTITATVLREGQRRQIQSVDLVPGDLVFLQSGDKVPADLRLMRVKELQVDESALTGESVPVQKQAESLPRDTLLADRANMAYSSTLVTYGIATGVVVASANATEIGRINELIASADILATPLTRKIARFSTVLLYVILGLGALTFFIGILRGESWLDMFMAVVALAVGGIPEGLPAAVTITLAIGVAKMARRNAVIRKLPAVETLGSTTVICSDKTGTLTQNQMTVQEIFAGGDLFQVSGTGYEPIGEFSQGQGRVAVGDRPALRDCLLAGLLCNDATVRRQGEEWRVEGDPTEAALLVAADKAGITRDKAMAGMERIDLVPFESKHQYMATLHGDGRRFLVSLKGSVEAVLARCDHVLARSGERVALDGEAVQQALAEMAARGLRVLAFARLELSEPRRSLQPEDVAAGLTFLGLQGMIDPPRPEAVASVRACHAAGIRVKMITGDHAMTAAAVAGQIGLFAPDSGSPEATAVLSGRDLEETTTEALIGAAEQTSVFARVAPEQKLRLVEALQASGHIVAMTGDGVNDAPALRQADIGVAMGITGTEVAKEAADMVLTDDNFSSIQAAIEEGRGVYDNLVKFITWTLPTNLGEGLVIMAGVLLGTQLPILPVQILWINMTTAVLLGLMLAFEPKEAGIMARPPQDPAKPLLTGYLIERVFLVGLLLLVGSFGLFEWELSRGTDLAAARTCAVNVFVFGELFYLFNCRSLVRSPFSLGLFSNPWLLAGVGAMIVLQLLFTYQSLLQTAFGSQALDLRQWGLVLLAAFSVFVCVELEKSIRQTRLIS